MHSFKRRTALAATALSATMLLAPIPIANAWSPDLSTFFSWSPGLFSPQLPMPNLPLPNVSKPGQKYTHQPKIAWEELNSLSVTSQIVTGEPVQRGTRFTLELHLSSSSGNLNNIDSLTLDISPAMQLVQVSQGGRKVESSRNARIITVRDIDQNSNYATFSFEFTAPPTGGAYSFGPRVGYTTSFGGRNFAQYNDKTFTVQ